MWFSSAFFRRIGNCAFVLCLPIVVRGGFTDRSALTPGLYNSNTDWCDYNGDGYPDISIGDQLWRNNAGVSFTDVTAAGFGPGTWGDYDNDGDQDHYCWNGTGTLDRNDGGTGFTPIATPSLPRDTTGTYVNEARGGTWGDFDGDGFLDLYVGGYELWSPSADFPDAILGNNSGTSFTLDWTQSSVYRARGVTACDFDKDGDLDIYVSNYRLQRNLLWLNNGSGSFTDVAGTYGVEGVNQLGAYGHTIGSSWGDVNNDGHMDLFVGNFSHPDWYQDRARFYENDGGPNYHFTERWVLDGGDWQESYASPSLADYDNDGDLDLYFSTVYGGDNSRLYRNNGNWSFTDVTAAEGLGGMPPTYQSAWADYNHDGFLDLLSGGTLWENQGNANHWLKIRLVGNGTTVNRDAIGAQVRIDLGGGTIMTRQVEANTGEDNQNEFTLHFGLGSRTAPVNLEIFWPDGTTQIVNSVPVDQMITQGSTPPEINWEISTGVFFPAPSRGVLPHLGDEALARLYLAPNGNIDPTIVAGGETDGNDIVLDSFVLRNNGNPQENFAVFQRHFEGDYDAGTVYGVLFSSATAAAGDRYYRGPGIATAGSLLSYDLNVSPEYGDSWNGTVAGSSTVPVSWRAGAGFIADTPVSDGSLFVDDFSSEDLSNWSTGVAGTGTIAYDGTQGNHGGSLRIESGTPDEAFGRPDLTDAVSETEWVVEFDFKLDSAVTAGSYFILYAGYGTGFIPMDIEVGLPPGTQATSAPYDLWVSAGSGGGGIDANLAWDVWHHFTIHRVFSTGVVTLYVNDTLLGTYGSSNPTVKLAEAQIGDVSFGNFFGRANWDNFSIGKPPAGGTPGAGGYPILPVPGDQTLAQLIYSPDGVRDNILPGGTPDNDDVVLDARIITNNGGLWEDYGLFNYQLYDGDVQGGYVYGVVYEDPLPDATDSYYAGPVAAVGASLSYDMNTDFVNGDELDQVVLNPSMMTINWSANGGFIDDLGNPITPNPGDETLIQLIYSPDGVVDTILPGGIPDDNDVVIDYGVFRNVGGLWHEWAVFGPLTYQGMHQPGFIYGVVYQDTTPDPHDRLYIGPLEATATHMNHELNTDFLLGNAWNGSVLGGNIDLQWGASVGFIDEQGDPILPTPGDETLVLLVFSPDRVAGYMLPGGVPSGNDVILFSGIEQNAGGARGAYCPFGPLAFTNLYQPGFVYGVIFEDDAPAGGDRYYEGPMQPTVNNLGPVPDVYESNRNLIDGDPWNRTVADNQMKQVKWWASAGFINDLSNPILPNLNDETVVVLVHSPDNVADPILPAGIPGGNDTALVQVTVRNSGGLWEDYGVFAALDYFGYYPAGFVFAVIFEDSDPQSGDRYYASPVQLSSPFVLHEMNVDFVNGDMWNGTVIDEALALDFDGDGLSNDFEMRHFGDYTSGNPALDTDFDRLSNLGEYIAGTDPMDGNSYFGVTSFSKDASGIMLMLRDTSPLRNYQCEYNDGLNPPGIWTPLGTTISGTGGAAAIVEIDGSAAPARAYRANVLLP